MKSGDFPKYGGETRFADSDEIGRVQVRVEETLPPKEMAGGQHRVYLERADSNVWRSFHFPLNAVLVVKEEPC